MSGMNRFIKLMMSVIFAAVFVAPAAAQVRSVATVAEFYNAVEDYFPAATDNVVIEVCEDLTLDALVTIPEPAAAGITLTIRSGDSAAPVTLTRGATGHLFSLLSGATLILEDIIIDGDRSGSFTDGVGALVYVNTGGTLIMNDGAVLRNNAGTLGGGVQVHNGTFTMTGGEINSNNGTGAGGVYVLNSTFNMSGGKIRGNAAVWGGGVRISVGDLTMFTMTGGEISGNTAKSTGGGVCAYDAHSDGIFLGGTAVISGNTVDGAPNNVYMRYNYIRLGTGSGGNGIAVPALGMKVGVTKSAVDSVIVQTGAIDGDEKYFFADEAGKIVIRDGEKLIITAKPVEPCVTTVSEFYSRIAAYAAATDNVVIEVCEDLTLDSIMTILTPAAAGVTLTIRSGDSAAPVTLTRGAKSSNLFTVSSGSALILEDIIVDGDRGNINFVNPGALSIVGFGGMLIMNDGAVLRNNLCNYSRDSSNGGAVIVAFGGTFTMTGGEISGNTANVGGGVFSEGAFNMAGGEISGNTANVGGGVFSEGVFNMTGGKISGNTTWSGGGGVFSEGNFNMTGGEISGNTASVGGGVFSEGKFTMTGGKISGNTSSVGGGVIAAGGSAFSLGGTAVINGNTKDSGVENNLFMVDGQYIALGTGAGGIAAPALGMMVGVTKSAADSMIVQTGAKEGDEKYFFADEAGKIVIRDGVRLIIVTPSDKKPVPTLNDIIYDLSSVIYNGSPQGIPPPAAAPGVTGLGAITVRYIGQTSLPVNAGTYSVIAEIAEGENYEAVSLILGAFTILPKPLDPNALSPLSLQVYSGKGITPPLTVMDGSKVLILNVDYTVSYTDNVAVGSTAAVVVTGIGNYAGEAFGTFAIARGRGPRLFAGPSPARRGMNMNFFWQGYNFGSGFLEIYDNMGNLVNKIEVHDEVFHNFDKRKIGSWDLTNRRGRFAARGAYLVRGAFITTEGKKEIVTVIIGVM